MPEHGEAMFVCRTWAELCLRLGRSVLCWPCLWLLVVSEKQRNVSVILRHAAGWLRSTKWWGRVFRRSQKLATSASTSSFTQVFLRGSLTWGPNVLYSGFTIPQLKDGSCRSVQNLVESDRCFPLLVRILNPYDIF